MIYSQNIYPLLVRDEDLLLHHHFHRSATDLDDGDIAGLNVGINSC